MSKKRSLGPDALADAFLREFGFRIESRPTHGPVLWRRGEKVYTEREAHTEAVKAEKARKALSGGL